jgi:hypothetical protein
VVIARFLILLEQVVRKECVRLLRAISATVAPKEQGLRWDAVEDLEKDLATFSAID